MPKKKTKSRRRRDSRAPQFLVLAGFLALIVAVLVLKEKPPAYEPVLPSSQLAEAQLDEALERGQPVLAFFHSNTCDTCLAMMAVVAQVYPQYREQVVLVDVNVYEEKNEPLLRRVRLRYIPTLIFYDQDGEAEPYIGSMDAAELSERLAAFSGGQP
jgi:thiol-disulfide isomerase/thioredoxin